MVGGDAGFEGGVDEGLLVPTAAGAGVVGVGAGDFEDGAGAVTDEEIAIAIEGDACGNAHALGIGGDGAFGRDAVDGAFGAGTDVEITVGTEGEASGVEEVTDEGADLKI